MPHGQPAWDKTVVQPGSSFERLLDIVKLLGGTVIVERGHGNLELFDRRANPPRIRITAKKTPRSEAPEHVIGWLHSLYRACKRDDPRTLELAVGLLNTKMIPLLDEILSDEDKLEVERANAVEADRLAHIERQKAHAAKRQREAMEMGAPHTPEHRNEKLRLRRVMFEQAARLKLNPFDLGQLFGMTTNTIEEWKRNSETPPSAGIDRLQEWIDVLKAMPTPPVAQEAVARPAPAPVPAASKSSISTSGDDLLVTVNIPATQASVALDLKALSDVTLLSLQHALGSEMLRRARGGGGGI